MIKLVPEITELDLNPVIAGSDFATVADVRIRVNKKTSNNEKFYKRMLFRCVA